MNRGAWSAFFTNSVLEFLFFCRAIVRDLLNIQIVAIFLNLMPKFEYKWTM
jgi:hypothetical protein